MNQFIEHDKHYMKIYNLHKKVRTHSYVNIGWMLFCLSLTFYFAYYLFIVESDVKCKVVHIQNQNSNATKYLFYRV